MLYVPFYISRQFDVYNISGRTGVFFHRDCFAFFHGLGVGSSFGLLVSGTGECSAGVYQAFQKLGGSERGKPN